MHSKVHHRGLAVLTVSNRPRGKHGVTSAKHSVSRRAHVAQWRGSNANLNPQRRVGAQAIPRLAQANVAAHRVLFTGKAPRHAAHDLARIRATENDPDLIRPQPEGPGAVLASPGRQLPAAVRRDAELLLGCAVPDARIHTDAAAAAASAALGARAFTVGRHVAFGDGVYAPQTFEGRFVLAHELAHVVQQRRAARAEGGPPGLHDETQALERDAHRAVIRPAWRPASSALSREAIQRLPVRMPIPWHTIRQALGVDLVFIMGRDRGGFYTLAERYFRARLPNATFVTNVRTLNGILTWVSNNVQLFVNNLYIVSHANEDGTLSFALNANDTDTHVEVNELRTALHPAGGGPSVLPQADNKIDAFTRIHIKGCDLGRTPSIVELIDEAFGGHGIVDAPTHEQFYGVDPQLGRSARAAFRRDIEASHAMPPEIDPALQGRERASAVRQRQAALRARRTAIAREIRARRTEGAAVVERAQTYEALTGPMFQRPGAQLFTAAEIRPEVDRLYDHLSDAQRATLVRRLLARDRRPSAVAHRQGVFRQQGMRAYRYVPATRPFLEPRTRAEIVRVLARSIRQTTGAGTRAFAVTHSSSSRVPQAGGGFLVHVELEGRTAGNASTFTFNGDFGIAGPAGGTAPVPDDAALIDLGRAQINNPDRYAWSVQERRNGVNVTRTAVAQRVIAYLHHGSLDPSAHEHFAPPVTDPDFYVESTFTPAAP